MSFRHFILLISCWVFTSLGQIPPESLKEMQEESGEKLFITILETIYDTTITEDEDSVVESTVTALVDTVFESETNLSVGDTIQVSYYRMDHWGSIEKPYVSKSQYVPAFLNWNDMGFYKPAAVNVSFSYIFTPETKEKRPIVNDSLWEVYGKSGEELTPLGYCSLEKDGENLLFYKGDSLFMRCYSFRNKLCPSPHLLHYLQPTYGCSYRKGSIISFASADETMDSLIFVLPDEQSAHVDNFLRLYTKDITLEYASFDPSTQRALLHVWGEESYRVTTIGYGEQDVVIKEGVGLSLFLDSSSKKLTLSGLSKGVDTAVLDSLVFIRSWTSNAKVIIGNVAFKLDSLVDSRIFMHSKCADSDILLKEYNVALGETLSFQDPLTDDTLSLSIIDTHTDTTWHRRLDYVLFKKLNFTPSVPTIVPVKSSLSYSHVKGELAIVSVQGRILYEGNHRLADVPSLVSGLSLSSGVYFVRQSLAKRIIMEKIRVK